MNSILSAITEFDPQADLELVKKAFAFASHYHLGQTRASGEPYISHVKNVALLAARLRLDLASVAAALLHDLVEDTHVTLATLEAEFGEEVARIVDGVTKLSLIKFSSREEQQAENFRKMLLCMARDIRVLLLKLCDRTHNMRTLEFLSESRRIRIAQETLDIYAPLAHRLGIYWMKSELEDLALRYLKPEIYQKIKHFVSATKVQREDYISTVAGQLREFIELHNLEGTVSGRAKHFFSIFQKMESHNLEFDEIHDLTAFRIIVETKMDCYSALGIVHDAWRPVPGRFKDYIAMPKANQYQSLHTTVIGPNGRRIEIQIRTAHMHRIAEKGIAAHWAYKEASGKGRDGQFMSQLNWLRDMIESGRAIKDPVEFISSVKEGLFNDEVYAFTPKGDLLSLAMGSTVIDFAYAIHSEVGHHCKAARIDGRQVPLSYQLQNGDTAEIITSRHQSPSKDWIKKAVTTKARQKIRAWLKSEERKKSISVGKELMQRGLSKLGLSFNKLLKSGELQTASGKAGFQNLDLCLADIGYGKVNTERIIGELVPEEDNLKEKLESKDSTLKRIFKSAAKVFTERSSVLIDGMEDIVFRFAKCCDPLPGDEVVGYITRGRGVVIHKRFCSHTLSFDPKRLVAVSWKKSALSSRSISLRIHCIDKPGLLASLSQSISAASVNISAAQITSTPYGKSICDFILDIKSAKQLRSLIRTIEGLKGVTSVERYAGSKDKES